MKDEVGNKARINHIIEAIENIEIITDGIELEDFLTNLEKKLAV
ncbi:hypothetical protein [Flavobacterium sp.]|jgi:uncharacterized protein with HEPN domain